MRSIISVLLSTFRAKFTSYWTKFKLLLSPTFWRTKGITILRQFLSRLFSVKPRSKEDYYTLSHWMVSKRLAFALVVCLGIVSFCFVYFMLPAFGVDTGFGSKSTVPTYHYNSIALKFKSGVVQILAKDDHVAYIGSVEDGYAAGSGKVINANNITVYEGQLERSMYNGSGRFYYSDGTLAYEGNFVDNLYDGQGTSYLKNGLLEYTGAFRGGLKEGEGTLYDSGGNAVFTGPFHGDHLVYGSFIGKTTQEAAELYTGDTVTYSASDEYCIYLPAINALYGVRGGENSLTQEWKITDITVLQETFHINGKEFTQINQLTGYFGNPVYFGTTWVKLPEAVAINLLPQKDGGALGKVSINMQETFDDVYTVEDYDKNYETYIYVYQSGGLLYTFYCQGSATENFVMYSIEQE